MKRAVSWWLEVLKGVCTNVDQNLIADQHNFRAKYFKMVRRTELKSRCITLQLLQYLIYADLIGNLLDPRFVDPGSTLIHIGAYDLKNLNPKINCVT